MDKDKRSVYCTWSDMINRCKNDKHRVYKNYGGRGIKVCDEWLIFNNFYKFMGKRPSSKHELDRRDNNGNYEPDNCRWVTRFQNNQNTRKSKRWVINGIMFLSSTEAAKFCGTTHQTVQNWCNKNKRGYKAKENCYSYFVYPKN